MLKLRIFYFALILFSACHNPFYKNTKVTIPAAEFAQKLEQNPSFTLVDVRTPDEFGKGHLANAKNIDWNNTAFEAEIKTLDPKKPVLIYCLSGGRSNSALHKMQELGFKEVYELDGGIMKWRGANLPETVETKPTKAELSLADYEALYNTDETILIDFYAEWCGPCKKMKPYLEEISQDASYKTKVLRINADDNQALCKTLGIDALPVLKLYKNKQLVWQNVGMIEKAKVVAQLQ